MSIKTCLSIRMEQKDEKQLTEALELLEKTEEELYDISMKDKSWFNLWNDCNDAYSALFDFLEAYKQAKIGQD